MASFAFMEATWTNRKIFANCRDTDWAVVLIVLQVTLHYILNWSRRGCVRHPWLRAPPVVACATRGGGRSEAGHSFHLFFSHFFGSKRACVRHTWWRTKRSWPLFSPIFFFFFLFSKHSAFHPLGGNSRG